MPDVFFQGWEGVIRTALVGIPAYVAMVAILRLSGSAIALLVLMQFVMTWTSLRWQALQKILKSSPTLLFYRGEFLEDSMPNERITKEEILAAVRSARLPDLERVEAVVLESDGSLSVISQRLGEESRSLEKIARDSR